jgi:HlyD family secretion protein
MNPKRKKIIIGVVALATFGTVVKLLFFRENFLYAGTIEATKVDVPARVSSVISTRPANEGDHINSGQTLMTLACEDYKLVASISNTDYDRADRLFRQGSQAKENYDQMKNRKDDADLKVSWCDIRSPLNGVVFKKYHEVGELVSPGTRLFTLANLKDDIYAYIYVPQDLIATLSLGQKVQGTLPELKSKRFSGTITQISNEAEFTPKNVQTREERTRLVFAVKVAFENADETLKPGMTIEVKLPETK